MSHAPTPIIDLGQAGPSEHEWNAVCAALPPFVWPSRERLVVVSPHPDDETLGSGGAMSAAAQRGMGIVLLSVTDGEAAFDELGLAARRRGEVTAALAVLVGDGRAEHHFASLPDGAVSDAVEQLVTIITATIRPNDLVITPLPDDGHPDHAATARAAAAACSTVGAALWHAPIWAWHCHAPATSSIRRGRRVELTDEDRRRKRLAVECFPSQTGGLEPVVPPMMLTRLTRDFEVLVPANHEVS
ncbi:MAG: PIG-L family deacetylase [Actinobacteria bacterium]|nr:PIG-L family deacetylase [Actinomycetota bacterium]